MIRNVFYSFLIKNWLHLFFFFISFVNPVYQGAFMGDLLVLFCLGLGLIPFAFSCLMVTFPYISVVLFFFFSFSLSLFLSHVGPPDCCKMFLGFSYLYAALIH